MKNVSEEMAKELALICCFIMSNDMLNGTIMQTFDRAFVIAQRFVKKYPLDTKWGVDVDLEYEETIVEFVQETLRKPRDTKSLTPYVVPCTKAMFEFLKDKDLDKLLTKLKEAEEHARNNGDRLYDKEEGIWFRFFKGDTAATTLMNIQIDLSLAPSHPNRKLMIEKMEMVTKGINPDEELRVFFS